MTSKVKLTFIIRSDAGVFGVKVIFSWKKVDGREDTLRPPNGQDPSAHAKKIRRINTLCASIRLQLVLHIIDIGGTYL